MSNAETRCGNNGPSCRRFDCPWPEGRCVERDAANVRDDDLPRCASCGHNHIEWPSGPGVCPMIGCSCKVWVDPDRDAARIRECDCVEPDCTLEHPCQPGYDTERDQWVPKCPHGDLCTRCDAQGYCERGREAESDA